MSVELTQVQKDDVAGITNSAQRISMINHYMGVNIDEADDLKVSIVDGKDLSANDFTTELKDKLDTVADGATANSTDEYLLASVNHIYDNTDVELDAVNTQDAITELKTMIDVVAENDQMESFANIGSMIHTNTANISRIKLIGVND